MIEPPAQDEVQSVEEAQTLRRDEQIGRLRGQPFACGLERRRSRDGVACPFQRFREPRHSRRSLVDDQDRIRHADTPATPRPTQRFSDAALTRTMQTAYAGKPVERTSAARQPVVLWNIEDKIERLLQPNDRGQVCSCIVFPFVNSNSWVSENGFIR